MKELLRMEGIKKSFSGVTVLDEAGLTLYCGEVLALLGENGAGKSTLIKILGGAYTKDEGEIFVNGEKVHITDVESAKHCGIRVIHQELMVIPHMTVAENIFLGQEPVKKGGLLDQKQMYDRAEEFLKGMGLLIDPEQRAGRLSIAKQQMIEIIRAISFGAKIIVMDEPTSSLTDTEVETLFGAIGRLKEKGVGIIYISHRMSELSVIADRITVMRDGKYIDTVDAGETDHDRLVKLMVGRSLGDLYDKHDHSSAEVVLKVERLASGSRVREVSFELKKGEVLGFSGLVGAGRSETMDCIFGLRKKESGRVYLDGKEVRLTSAREAVSLGIGLVPEDRKLEGIYESQGIRFNTTIEVLDHFLKWGCYDREKEAELTKRYVDDVMQTKYAGLEQPIGSLSGGNQQKVMISRWLLVTRKILILDEPTRGIDVKTKAEIYHLIDRLTKDGLSIIFISSEMPELIHMCDRIVVMSGGYTTGVLEREEFSQETIMGLSTKEM